MNNSIFNYFTLKQKNSQNTQNLEKKTPDFNSISQKNNYEQTAKKSIEELSDEEFNPKQLKRINKWDVFNSEKVIKFTKSISQKKNKTEKQKQPKTPKQVQPIENLKYDIIDTTPDWAKPENIRDQNQRKPGEPEYDFSTLYIPENGLDSVTPARRQYWEIKSKNFDKLILFKLGKFYELFEDDALLAAKHLDLNLMGNKKRAGFPEMALDKYLQKLVQLGIKVAIVEQVETEKEMQKRLQQQKFPKHEKILKRDLVSMHTKGTFVDVNMIDENYQMNFIWCLQKQENFLFLSFLNFETNSLYLEILDTNSWKYIQEIKLYVSKFYPAEILFHSSISETIKTLFLNLPSNPLQTDLKNLKEIYQEDFFDFLKKFENFPFIEKLKQILFHIENFKRKGLIQNLFSLFSYLNSLLLLEKALVGCEINFISEFEETGNMYLNSQALEHLEIFENSQGEEIYSLFWLINKCNTNFGKRLLKNWLLHPLFNEQQIYERQESIVDLENNKSLRDEFQNKMKKIKDLQKMYHYLSKFSLQQKQKVIFFGDISTKRINELQNFFMNIQNAELCLRKLEKNKEEFKSPKIKNILENIPEIGIIIKNIQKQIRWKENIPMPERGFDLEFDKGEDQIKLIEKELDDYLETLRKQFNCKDVEQSKGKYRFEIQIPLQIIKKIKLPQDFEFSSRGQKYEKFVTNFLKMKIEQIEILEEKQKERLYFFISHIFSIFANYKEIWLKIINLTAELDVLSSLSIFSHQEYLTLCRPKIKSLQENMINVKNIKHPVLYFKNGDFVGNNLQINQDKRIFILTGPNMGGKSTIMRTLCTNIILAQIGSFVFADEFEWSLVDKIFTRIGASDRLEEKKSTFFIEMEETMTILENATENSLAIIDELGRGTSTFDGYSIATSTLKYIYERINCKVIFATHYFFIKEDLGELDKNLVYIKMDYEIVNQEEDKIIFLYKVVQGFCERSFAFNVARLAGLKESIIKRAQKITQEFRNHLHIQLILQMKFTEKFFDQKKNYFMLEINQEILQNLEINQKLEIKKGEIEQEKLSFISTEKEIYVIQTSGNMNNYLSCEKDSLNGKILAIQKGFLKVCKFQPQIYEIQQILEEKNLEDLKINNTYSIQFLLDKFIISKIQLMNFLEKIKAIIKQDQIVYLSQEKLAPYFLEFLGYLKKYSISFNDFVLDIQLEQIFQYLNPISSQLLKNNFFKEIQQNHYSISENDIFKTIIIDILKSQENYYYVEFYNIFLEATKMVFPIKYFKENLEEKINTEDFKINIQEIIQQFAVIIDYNDYLNPIDNQIDISLIKIMPLNYKSIRNFKKRIQMLSPLKQFLSQNEINFYFQDLFENINQFNLFKKNNFKKVIIQIKGDYFKEFSEFHPELSRKSVLNNNLVNVPFFRIKPIWIN